MTEDLKSKCVHQVRVKRKTILSSAELRCWECKDYTQPCYQSREEFDVQTFRKAEGQYFDNHFGMGDI